MNILIGTVLIGGMAVWLWRQLPNTAWRQAGLKATGSTLIFTVPRMVLALLGAGFFAALLPADQVRGLLGKDSGLSGIVLATMLGPVTPGGAFVAFAVAAAALKAGASTVAALVYVTSWSLFSLTKILAYEWPIMGRSEVALRVFVSLPAPLAVALFGYFLVA